MKSWGKGKVLAGDNERERIVGEKRRREEGRGRGGGRATGRGTILFPKILQKTRHSRGKYAHQHHRNMFQKKKEKMPRRIMKGTCGTKEKKKRIMSMCGEHAGNWKGGRHLHGRETKKRAELNAGTKTRHQKRESRTLLRKRQGGFKGLKYSNTGATPGERGKSDHGI